MRPDAHLKIDFHALRVMLAIHEHGSISHAAERLDMSQSSVSYILERLRNVFDDPLFVRLGRGIRPTDRCNDIAGHARLLLQRYEDMVVPAHFDPRHSTDTFILACNFYERSVLLPPLIQRLRRIAPDLRLQLLSADIDGMRQFETDICDLVISPVRARTSGLRSERLIHENYACFVSHDSPWCHRPLDLVSYARAGHIMVRPYPNWRPYFLTTLDDLGVRLEPQVEVSSFGEIDRIIENTDLILTASQGFSRFFAARTTCIKAPFECSFSVYMSWAGRTHKSPAHIWFRDQIRQVIRALPSLEPPLQPG